MEDKIKARTSAGWEAPTYDERGKFWVAHVRYRLTDREHAVGLETAVYGPDMDACAAEARRQDRAWCEFPLRTGDHDAARARLRYLAGGAL